MPSFHSTRKMTLIEDKDTARKTLEEYTKDWQALIEILPNPVSIHDTESNIVLANKALIDLCGKTGDVRGIKYYKLIYSKDTPPENCPVAKTLKSGNPERSEIYDPSLKRFLVVMTAPIRIEGSFIGVIHSVMDMTELKKSEEDYSELVDIYASTINKMKIREIDVQKGRDAFLNMLDDITESYKELEDLFINLITTMVNALDAKSPWTKGHSENVAKYAELIAKEMGLDEDGIKNLRLAGLLHDIGKIGTYDYLLDKSTGLTDKEFEIVKKHPAQGAKILEGIKQLKDIIPLIRHHHERIDGKGYPDGLKGEEIPFGAKILHVVDSFDSMMTERPYRPAPGIDYAKSEFKKHSGSQFDPQVTEAFLRVLDKLQE